MAYHNYLSRFTWIPYKFRKPLKAIYYYPPVKKIVDSVLSLKIKNIDTHKILLGGECGINGYRYSVVTNNFLRASTPSSSGPHIKFLQEYERLGKSILDDKNLSETDYYKNAIQCIKLCGHYFNFTNHDDIKKVCAKFIEQYEEDKKSKKEIRKTSYKKNPVLLIPIKYSSYYQLYEGNHRIARAQMLGEKEIPAFIIKKPVITPLQDLLSDVMWLQGRREIYQPLDFPEIKESWKLVRKCTDRFEMMKSFLKEIKLNEGQTYIDLGCSYGWFVKEMEKQGLKSCGVDRDYFAKDVGLKVYGLSEDQIILSDVGNFLKKEDKQYDIVSLFSVLHHYVINKTDTTPEELIKMIDKITGKVLFFETGQSHEHALKEKLKDWNDDFIINWLKSNTSFKEITILGKDSDNVGDFVDNYRRTLFACVK